MTSCLSLSAFYVKSVLVYRTLPVSSIVNSTRSFSVLSQSPRSCTHRHILPKTSGFYNPRALSSGSSVAQDYLSASSSVFGWMANLPPTVFIQDKLCYLHDVLGLEWWACIVTATFLLRFCMMLPASIVAQRTIAKKVLLKEEMDTVLMPAVRKVLDQHVREGGWSEGKAKFHFKVASKAMYKAKEHQYGCRTYKIFLPMVLQTPVWIFTTVAIRNLVLQRSDPGSMESVQRLSELSTEGCLWFQNLVVPDPTLGLPVLVAASFLAGTEVSSLQFYEKNLGNKIKGIQNTLWRLVAVAIAGVSAQCPSVLALYWMLSGSSGLGLNLLLMSPKVRRWVRIPQIKSEEQNPYKLLAGNFKLRLRNQSKALSEIMSRKSKK